MKAHKGTFKKKNGQAREMIFAHLYDLPETFLNKRAGGGDSKTYEDGMELVWDIEADNFRVFNFNTIQGEISTLEIEDSTFE